MKFRECMVKPWVVPFSVPMYVSRVDIDDGGAGTHGWQVRYFLAKYSFFSDHNGIERRHPKESLKEATEYLQEHWKGPKSRLRDPGHKLVWRKKYNKSFKEAYVQIIYPGTKKYLRVYLGTESTFTQERLEAGTKLLLEKYKKAVAEYQSKIQNS